MNAASIPLVDILPDETINARRTKSDEGLDELKASIAAHGLAQSLRVREGAAGKFKIIAGHRRYRVLCELASEGGSAGGVAVTDTFKVPVIVGDEDDTTAREISQAENLIRLPQHEADTYQTFRELADRGLDEGQIASRFGIEPKRVKRMLALGRLSPVILEAWRGGEFDRYHGGIDTVRAFTLAASIEDQERVYRDLSKRGSLWSHLIRQEFGADDREARRNLTFVGVDAYTKAGGTVIEDLFGENHAISDAALAKRLADEKLRATADKIGTEGWSWAAVKSDLPDNWYWNWQKLGLSKKKATKAQKAMSGVVVEVDHQGRLQVTYGVVRPDAAKKEKAAGDKTDKGAPMISAAMAHRLSIAATLAAAEAIVDEPRAGLVALLAGFFTWSGGPVKVSHSGIGDRTSRVEREDFSSAFSRLSAMSDDDLFRVAAGIAGKALDMQSQNPLRRAFEKGGDVLAAAIDGGRMTAALAAHFDAADYFGGVSKPIAVQAIREALNEDEARKAEKLKKKELVDFAVKNVVPTGWLPPELRCATYGGPGAIPVGATTDDPDFDEIEDADDGSDDLQEEAA